MPEIATIGVYCFTAETFLGALKAADVRLLVDVRQRRGVRGPHFTWANAQRLQALVAEAGIAYSHHRELAPTTELRQLQYREDDLNQLTAHGLFSEGVQTAQDGSTVIVLTPLPPQ